MFTVEVDYPPSFNHQHTIFRGRPVLTREARAFRQSVRQQVKAARLPVFLGPLAVRIELFPPDARRRDNDNAQKPINDALQQSGVFVDDSQIVWLLSVRQHPVPGGKAIVHFWRLADGPVPTEFFQCPQS